MQTAQIRLKENEMVEPCPKCGQNTNFVLHSHQFAEDCCDVWVECICGYDHGDRREDVWGGLSKEIAQVCIADWNDVVPKMTVEINS